MPDEQEVAIKIGTNCSQLTKGRTLDPKWHTKAMRVSVELAAAPADNEGLCKAEYPDFFKKSKLSLRFSTFSTLKEKAERLKL